MSQEPNKPSNIAEVFAQSKANAAQIIDLSARIDTLSRGQEAIRDSLVKGLNEVRDRVTNSGTPNFQTLAAWATVLLGIVAMIAAPIAYYFNHSIEAVDSKLQKEYSLVNDTLRERVDSQRHSLEELDVRLQREFIAAQDNVKQTAVLLREDVALRHSELLNQVHALEGWNSDRIKADLEELRIRRMGGQK